MGEARAYYNEIDPYAAAWLRNLIAAGHVAPGDVDERSIVDVQPSDLDGYTQCHFFAGIGGWSLATRLAGWDDTREIWTGSCPCQPFSSAGRKVGLRDPRHLWPYLRTLIKQRSSTAFFGEQVASAAEWVANVHRDLEAMGYAVGALPIEAASAGGQQRRDRFWIVASGSHHDDWRPDIGSIEGQEPKSGSRVRPSNAASGESRIAGRLLPDASVPLLAHEIPNRLAQYRAFGNAIDPRLAAEVIGAYLDLERTDA